MLIFKHKTDCERDHGHRPRNDDDDSGRCDCWGDGDILQTSSANRAYRRQTNVFIARDLTARVAKQAVWQLREDKRNAKLERE